MKNCWSWRARCVERGMDCAWRIIKLFKLIEPVRRHEFEALNPEHNHRKLWGRHQMGAVGSRLDMSSRNSLLRQSVGGAR